MTGQGFVRAASATSAKVLRKAGARVRAARQRPYARAAMAKLKMAPKFAATKQLPVWRPLGPMLIPKGQTYGTGGNNAPPVSGRCVGIVISPTNPAHLVLCSGGGGLWGTLDGGASWQPLTDQQPTLSMGAIASAPSSPNIVYAGTGEGDNVSQLGVGLLRSSDGGATWQHQPAAELSGLGVYDIAVDPANPLHVWVGTTENLLESVTGGATWRVAQPVTTWDVSINPSNPLEIFAATVVGLIRSANGGATWSLVALPGTSASTRFARMEVCHAPSNPAIVYVTAVFNDRAALWRRATSGGGFSTETPAPLKADSDINQSWYDWCLAVSPTDSNVIYWGAVELYRGARASGGWTWRNIASRSSGDSIHPDQHHLAFDPSDPNVLYACNDGGVFRSPNGGTNWKSLNPGLSITEFEFLSQRESDPTWIIGGTQDNGTLGQPVGGRWDQIAPGDGGDCGADDAGQLCYHSYYGIWIERAPASGPRAFQWVDVSPPAPKDYDALFYPPMDVRGALIAKAGVSLWVSDDTGDTWTEVDFGGQGERASALTIVDGTTMVVGTERGRLCRVTRGIGWANADVTVLTSPRGGFVSDIVVTGSPNKLVWVSYSSFGGGHVFRSTNGGTTWTNCSGNLPDIPVNAIVVDPTNTKRLFAATDHGVYRSQNAGTKWADFSNGLPHVVVGDMILHERLRLLRIGTRSRGAWEVGI
jgi:photosystem II stability/assembly factor-like uncharacterized protein